MALAVAGAMGEARERQEGFLQGGSNVLRSRCVRVGLPRHSQARSRTRAGREDVRIHLEKLLTNRDFVETYCGDHVPRGLKVLYEDPDLGFQVLAHINDKARVSPPHDHGASWAIYGQATHLHRHDRNGSARTMVPIRPSSSR